MSILEKLALLIEDEQKETPQEGEKTSEETKKETKAVKGDPKDAKDADKAPQSDESTDEDKAVPDAGADADASVETPDKTDKDPEEKKPKEDPKEDQAYQELKAKYDELNEKYDNLSASVAEMVRDSDLRKLSEETGLPVDLLQSLPEDTDYSKLKPFIEKLQETQKNAHPHMTLRAFGRGKSENAVQSIDEMVRAAEEKGDAEALSTLKIMKLAGASS